MVGMEREKVSALREVKKCGGKGEDEKKYPLVELGERLTWMN